MLRAIGLGAILIDDRLKHLSRRVPSPVLQHDRSVIVASIRNPIHFVESAMMGAHISTLPYKVLMQLVEHPLTDIGLKKFLADWEKVPK